MYHILSLPQTKKGLQSYQTPRKTQPLTGLSLPLRWIRSSHPVRSRCKLRSLLQPLNLLSYRCPREHRATPMIPPTSGSWGVTRQSWPRKVITRCGLKNDLAKVLFSRSLCVCVLLPRSLWYRRAKNASPAWRCTMDVNVTLENG